MRKRDERNALVEKHTEYARSLALEIAQSLPYYHARDELVSAANAGLVEAAQRFDPTRGALFSTFAYYRVRGAVFDHVRHSMAANPVARAKAAVAAALDDAIQAEAAGYRRSAKDTPANAAEALAKLLDVAASAMTLRESVEALSGGNRGPGSPEDQTVRRQESLAVREAIETLPDKEQALLKAVYYDGDSIEEAGARAGLSKSWASRLHARALAMMGRKLKKFRKP